MDDITKRLRLIDPTLELRYCEDVTKLHEIGQWCHMAQGLWIEEIERLRNLLREIAFSAGRAVASGDSERIRIELLEIAFKTGRAVLGEKE